MPLPDVSVCPSSAPEKGENHPARSPVKRRGLNRRKFLFRTLAAGAAASIGTAGYAWRIEPTWVRTIERKMPFPGLGAGLKGYRIVQLSDLHVGGTVPMAYLQDVVDRVNSSRPDLVVITGDLVQNGQPAWTRPMARLVASLEAPDGVVTILGNHDWNSCAPGHGHARFADQVESALFAAGVMLLRNQSLTIERNGDRLHLVGLDDYWSSNYDPDRAFAGVPADEPCIALTHNPDSFVEILDTPADWTLAGHTHGGQVRLPFVGPPILPIRHRQFAAGECGLAGRKLYVNRGVGWLRRVRLGVRPEITDFTLTST